MNELNYADVLSGDPVFIDGIGHIKSPKLKELTPSNNIGFWKYNFYLNFLSWDKENLIKYLNLIKEPNVTIISNEKISMFDSITLLNSTREVFISILKLFLVENPVWDERKRSFYICKNETHEQKKICVGKINRENFERVKTLILNLNYIGLESKPEEIKHSSEASRLLWEIARNYEAKRKKGNTESDAERYDIGNIISKICVISPGYNLLNIYNLTVFQLYDQFFQCGYLRVMNLSQDIYSNHGGEDFDIQRWMNPIGSLLRG